MNKTFKSILALAIGAVAMTFASCSSDEEVSNAPSQQEIEAKIVGKWKTIKYDGTLVPTNNRAVLTYFGGSKATISISEYISSLHTYAWANKSEDTWSVEDNVLCNKGVKSGMLTFRSITTIDEKNCSYVVTKVVDSQGNEYIQNSKQLAEKVTADYSNDIIGMWEGVEMTGPETYGNAEARIEYKADGTYTYYKKKDDYWMPSTNVDNEYNVDGDWLASRWRPEAGADYNYEWWDIDEIKDGMMKWSALREKENGERFTTTFTWKKVR